MAVTLVVSGHLFFCAPASCEETSKGDASSIIRRVVESYRDAVAASVFEATFVADGASALQTHRKFGGYRILRAGPYLRVTSTQVARDSAWIVGKNRVWEYLRETNEHLQEERDAPQAEGIVSFAESLYRRFGGRFADLLKLTASFQHT